MEVMAFGKSLQPCQTLASPPPDSDEKIRNTNNHFSVRKTAG
jgi:hypothetical protein